MRELQCKKTINRRLKQGRDTKTEFRNILGKQGWC